MRPDVLKQIEQAHMNDRAGASVTRCGLQVSSERTQSHERVLELLSHGAGWLTVPSDVIAVADGYKGTERVLAGEVATDDNTSVAVAWDGEAWCFTTLRQQPGDDHIAFDVAHLSAPARKDAVGSTGGRLRYRVYWRRQLEQELAIWRPFAARWLGFEPTESNR